MVGGGWPWRFTLVRRRSAVFFWGGGGGGGGGAQPIETHLINKMRPNRTFFQKVAGVSKP